MSKSRGIWGSGLLPLAMLDWCKSAAGRYLRLFAGRSRMAGQENRFELARPNASMTVQIDLAGGLAEFKRFAAALRIGDRIRAFCDDGVIEAEKISPTRFKLIYFVETIRSIQ
jgi:hypothetical protein